MIKLQVLSCVLLFTMSCNQINKSNSDKQEGAFIRSGDTIIVPEKSPLHAKMSLKTVVRQEYHAHFNATGTVKTLAGCLAEIATPFEGRITKSYVRLGQKVSAGTPVFEIYSPDYFETVKMFIQAKQERQLATNNYFRQKELLEHGVGSRKDFDEAESAWQIAGKEFEKAEASLLIFNVKPEEITPGRPLVVRSPIAGEIVKSNIIVGQYVKSDAEAQAVVADLAKVWVVAQVKEKNIGLINSIDSVHVITEAHPEKQVNGIVSYIGSMLDEQTRAVEVFVECSNSGRTMKPGMFANISFTRQLPEALVIPASAILQEEDDSYVFVQSGNNRYVRRNVSVTTGNEKEVIVNSGLSANETIVAEGAVYFR